MHLNIYLGLKKKIIWFGSLPDGTQINITNPLKLNLQDGMLVQGKYRTETLTKENGFETHFYLDVEEIKSTLPLNNDLKQEIATMSMNERVAFFNDITSGYCLHCGDSNPRCPCNRDE